LGELIERKHFFVIHAPRQSGKTTLLNALEQQLEAGERYHALYCSLESVQGVVDPKEGIPAAVRSLQWAVRYHPRLRACGGTEPARMDDFNNVLRVVLAEICARLDRPLVVLFDEADCLSEGTLIAFLRQLRDGYVNRIRVPFVHALALVGMRNIRDYKARVREDGQTLGSASPFNIVVESLTLENFTRDEVAALYGQHTDETGQAFPPGLVDRVHELTQGQPWLVNALAREMIVKLGNNDLRRALTPDLAEVAAERIIVRRDTHIDSLLERLKEERVRRVIEPMLLGEGESIDELSDDYRYVRDLGLIRSEQGVLRPANPIYAEVIARTLNHNVQQRLPVELINRWMDGQRLDLDGLLRGFQEFWRDHSEAWIGRFEYQEAAPHLILLAYLQRVTNGGARIVREFATGTRRVDVCVEYAGRRYPLELKLVRGAKTRGEGLEQLGKYLETLGCEEGWLVLFAVGSTAPWEQRLSWETVERGGRRLHVVGA